MKTNKQRIICPKCNFTCFLHFESDVMDIFFEHGNIGLQCFDCGEKILYNEDNVTYVKSDD